MDELDAKPSVCRACAPSGASGTDLVGGRMVGTCCRSVPGLLGRRWWSAVGDIGRRCLLLGLPRSSWKTTRRAAGGGMRLGRWVPVVPLAPWRCSGVWRLATRPPFLECADRHSPAGTAVTAGGGSVVGTRGSPHQRVALVGAARGWCVPLASGFSGSLETAGAGALSPCPGRLALEDGGSGSPRSRACAGHPGCGGPRCGTTASSAGSGQPGGDLVLVHHSRFPTRPHNCLHDRLSALYRILKINGSSIHVKGSPRLGGELLCLPKQRRHYHLRLDGVCLRGRSSVATWRTLPTVRRQTNSKK